jgi:RNA polymerase sigma-70 factor, ECF subfamily
MRIDRLALLLTFLGRKASIQMQGHRFSLGWTDMAITLGARFAALEWPRVQTAASTDLDNEALVRAAQGGDRAAFGQLYQRYARMVHGILLARVPTAAAEDLLHDVFLQALRNLAVIREASRFGPWLAAIARNRATDFHRRSKPTDSLDSQPGAAAAVENPQREMAREDTIALLNAVRELPDVYRETLVMRFVEGMTGPEIAARTGLTHGSVRVNLHRGIEMLRENWTRNTPPAEKEKGS